MPRKVNRSQTFKAVLAAVRRAGLSQREVARIAGISSTRAHPWPRCPSVPASVIAPFRSPNPTHTAREMNMAIPLSDLVGKSFDFYGVSGCYFKLDDMVFLADEDPDDGYRSTLRSCETVDDSTRAGKFPELPLCRVTVSKTEHSRIVGWRLRDQHDLEVLVVGTNDSDDYYPSFHFVYTL